ncbi:hypothetical protein FB45DRAFT_1153539 [Roridomyces roridus]|uniref:MYND-type domain-containing protein n=1 Tax=Roridomyces roridus TaxID=1738132 RepID=A0AAD7F993_9AGAR|nr:hypothetical protein FB45DRAFT_1153539 [Roridomyces roridus]
MAVKKRNLSGSNTGAISAEAPSFHRLLAAARLSRTLDGLADEICRLLSIPDCRTSRGLKQAHESFDTIASKLDALFTESRQHRNKFSALSDYLATAVIVIYGRMEDDSILKRRIFTETNFLEQATTLLKSPDTGEIVMETLSYMTHYHDMDVLDDLAGFMSTIIDSVEPHLENIAYAEKAMCVLTHVTTTVLEEFDEDDDEDPTGSALLTRVLQFLIRVVRLPGSTSLSFSHFGVFCANNTAELPDTFLANQDSIDLLVASTRGQDICTRITAQRSLINLCLILEDDEDDPEFSNEQLVTLCDRYPDPCPVLGRELVKLILHNEVMVRNHFQTREGEGLLDLFLACEDAVRKTDSLTADILHLEWLLCIEEEEEAYEFARTAVERYPYVPFFYYVLAFCGEMNIATVLFAEKGLQCPPMTDFLRQQLLYFATFASHKVIASMAYGTLEEIRVQEMEALITKATGYASAFINISSPDDPLLSCMTALAIHLDFVMEGNKWTRLEIPDARDKFSLVPEVARSASKECIALNTILDRMSTAWKTWGPIVSRYSPPSRTTSSHNSDPTAELVAWLEKLNTTAPSSLHLELRGINPQTARYGAAQLHYCAQCSTASAALKQCSGCLKTRYCNDVCQRRHWKYHREACKASRVDA